MTFERVIGKSTSRGLRLKDVLHYLDAGGDLNRRDQKADWSLLHFAAEDGNAEVIRLLASRGADLNLRDRFGQTPLHIAVDRDLDTSARGGRQAVDMPTARALIEMGADESSKTAEGETPWDFAVAYGQQDLYDSLFRQRTAKPKGL
jgi:ankyrin repeat protein